MVVVVVKRSKGGVVGAGRKNTRVGHIPRALRLYDAISTMVTGDNTEPPNTTLRLQANPCL